MNQWFTLVVRNTLRHRLRTGLTLAGLVIAILAYGVLQTIIAAWYVDTEGALPTRLITRNAISFGLPLPFAYEKQIRGVEGVRDVTYLNWFGGIYKDQKHFFPQFAIEVESHFNIYPDFVVPREAMAKMRDDRRAALVGRQLADRHGFKPGDVIQLKGTLYPGIWELVIAGIFEGREPKTNTSQLFFRWDYLNDTLRSRSKLQADQVGFFIVDVVDANRIDEVSHAIDQLFKNSLAETRTETERAFHLGYAKQTEAILISIRIVSFVVIFIILAVMTNTMAMTARERISEYATLKALGFGPGYLARLILGESILIALCGGVIAIVLTEPVASRVAGLTDTLLPSLFVSGATMAWQLVAALAVGFFAALLPMYRAAHVRVVDGLRAIG